MIWTTREVTTGATPPIDTSFTCVSPGMRPRRVQTISGADGFWMPADSSARNATSRLSDCVAPRCTQPAARSPQLQLAGQPPPLDDARGTEDPGPRELAAAANHRNVLEAESHLRLMLDERRRRVCSQSRTANAQH